MFYSGTYETIPPTASAGLILLKELLYTLDTLSSSVPASLSDLMHPTAIFTLNGEAQTMPFLESAKSFYPDGYNLWSFLHHDLKMAWEMQVGDKRMVFWEGDCVRIVKKDQEQEKVPISEFSYIELEEQKDSKLGWKVSAMATWMDAYPMSEKMKKINKCKSETGEVHA
ncbi:hypothetical protein BT69DRAFT_1289264 [Atractiella rhizophila]|nr:hypothetical protein BT69DRAFT_1289264 [Atractiella rhizophila]